MSGKKIIYPSNLPTAQIQAKQSATIKSPKETVVVEYNSFVADWNTILNRPQYFPPQPHKHNSHDITFDILQLKGENGIEQIFYNDSMADGSKCWGIQSLNGNLNFRIINELETHGINAGVVLSLMRNGSVLVNGSINAQSFNGVYLFALNNALLEVSGQSYVSGVNTGDQDLSKFVTKDTYINGHPLSDGSISITPSDIGLHNVENINISTWQGSENLKVLGPMTVELTNDTTLTFKVTGSDGKVRTAKLTLE